MTKTLSLKVVERFMQGQDLENFVKQYQANRKSAGRENILNQPITEEDLYILKEYTTNMDRSIQDLADAVGIHMTSIYGRAMRVAVRVIAQHPEVLDQVVTVKNEVKKGNK